MAKKVAVVLSGCGVYDGAEIHEAVITLLALDRAGAEIVCAAPNVEQAHVVNHLTGDAAAGEGRNVLVEAARIARGAIVDLAKLDAKSVDAAIFPGGYGAAKNLCTWAFKQDGCEVNAEVARFVREMHAARKPLGFECIAPVVAAKLLGPEHPQVTIGTDAATAASVEKMGGKHVACQVREIAVDQDRRIVTTPAYMLAGRISEAADGIEKLVKAVLEFC
ncbi:MAG: isoprenoid biosynthesis glyoxalase ElbB [Deltaproteobacteria bacterium]|nr:isoprenoid biosynthesis glyoxalase ElbB [Deltaproteobacteria bacterium]